MVQSYNPRNSPELWGGVECTVNRVGDRYFDQLEWSGHDRRLSDLDRFHELGIRTLRFPILWERTSPIAPDDFDWRFSDERMARMQELGMKPIVGLLHHGSGPRYTSLEAPKFAERFAAFAERVAHRYPWVRAFTPVNEPLTTARFSCLYGHWYPHAREDRRFARALVNQIKAVVLSMEAIRKVIPEAKLVQTEDLGKTYSTSKLAYQAEFDNARRWLTWDLLTGKVDARHPLWGYLRRSGITETELAFFIDNQCPPDLIGINHYLTSSRFLDHRLDLYSPSLHGGNGRDAYADVEAVRVVDEESLRPGHLFEEAWRRYSLPIAITEAHLGCTREEQLRWLNDLWAEAVRLRRKEVRIEAVTAWALLGSFHWNKLVTKDDGAYEPGAFTVSSGEPKPTAMAALIRALSRGEVPDLPALDSPGWWKRESRLLRRPASSASVSASSARPLLIIGASEALGGTLAKVCETRGLEHRLVGRTESDSTDRQLLAHCLERFRPWAVIHTGARVLAEECARLGVLAVTLPSDLGFDENHGALHSVSHLVEAALDHLLDGWPVPERAV